MPRSPSSSKSSQTKKSSSHKLTPADLSSAIHSCRRRQGRPEHFPSHLILPILQQLILAARRQGRRRHRHLLTKHVLFTTTISFISSPTGTPLLCFFPNRKLHRPKFQITSASLAKFQVKKLDENGMDSILDLVHNVLDTMVYLGANRSLLSFESDQLLVVCS